MCLSDVCGGLKEKFGAFFHKIIFVEPIDEKGEKFRVVRQVYVNAAKGTLDKGSRDFPLSLKDWLYQRKAGIIEFRSWNDAKTVYGFYKRSELKKPDGSVLSSRELDADNTAKDAKAVFSGGSFGNPLLMMILAAVAAGAICLFVGYLVVPNLLGQHLVPNGVQVASMP